MTVGGVVVTAAPAIDDPVPGCDAVHGAGGVRAAVCGSGARPTEIRLVAADGTSRMLAGPVADVGHWRFALPSPDGKWVLAQWSAECEVPVAYLFEVATRERRPAGTDDSSRSVAIAWAPDGRAVVGLGPGPCGGSGDEPGTYLLDPRSRDRERLHPHTSGARIAHLNGWRLNRLERVFDRAREELGLEGCCFEPSHGGDDVDDGIVLDGHDIYVRAAPLSAPPAPPEPGELRFTCGQARYILSWFLDPRPDGRLLERAADLLVPHLYCTRGTNEHG